MRLLSNTPTIFAYTTDREHLILGAWKIRAQTLNPNSARPGALEVLGPEYFWKIMPKGLGLGFRVWSLQNRGTPCGGP